MGKRFYIYFFLNKTRLTITQDSLILQGLKIPIRVRKVRGKRMMMRFSEDSLLVDTYSGILSDTERDFIRQNEKWIVRTWVKYSRAWEEKNKFLSGIENQTLLFGKMAEVVFEISAGYRYHYKDGKLMIFAPEAAMSRKKDLIAAVLRKIAETYLRKSISFWASHTGMQINSVRVKNHQSKWGSCSSLRNINLNWHLVMLEKTLADYVVIHELMHLHEMNHSPAFWKWVEKYYPEHRKARIALRNHQWIIGMYA